MSDALYNIQNFEFHPNTKKLVQYFKEVIPVLPDTPEAFQLRRRYYEIIRKRREGVVSSLNYWEDCVTDVGSWAAARDKLSMFEEDYGVQEKLRERYEKLLAIMDAREPRA